MKAFANFFKFYYYLLRRSPKRFELVNKHPASFHIVVVPVIFMLIHMVIAMILLDMRFTHWLAIHILFVPGNLICYTVVRNEAWEIERRIRKEKEEALMAQQQEELDRLLKEAERLRKINEKAKRERERYEKQRKQKDKEKSYLEADYRRLGLSVGSDLKTVKATFRQLSKIYHPDMPNGNEEIFINLKKSYDKILAQLT